MSADRADRVDRADQTGPTLTVAICAYTTERWDDLCAAVDSVRAQTRPPEQLLLVIDHCPELLELARARLSDVRGADTRIVDTRIVANRQRRGLSGARNTALAEADGELIAFLDDDAVADRDWTAHLLAGYRDPAVLGVGGLVRPWWHTARPGWFPPEFDWVIGCSYRGLPRRPAPVRNFIGANMSFRRAPVLAAGGFRTDLGRVGKRPLGCEETELCIRLAARNPGAVLRHEPAAAVRHRVPAARTAPRYFAARCFAEGRSKAAVVRHGGTATGLASERRHLRRTLPAALLRSLRQGEPARAAALCAGTALTLAGYLTGRAARWTAPGPTAGPHPAPAAAPALPTGQPIRGRP